LNDLKLLAHIAKEIEKLRHEREVALAADRIESFEEYRNVCGVIRGLNLAENVINDLVQKLEQADD
jgi:hypothetical protein